MNRNFQKRRVIFFLSFFILLIAGLYSHWDKIKEHRLLVDALDRAEDNFLEAENKFNQAFEARPEQRKGLLSETEKEILRARPVYENLLSKLDENQFPFLSAQMLFRLGNLEFYLDMIKREKSGKAKDYWAEALRIVESEEFLVDNKEFSELKDGCSANLEIEIKVNPPSKQEKEEREGEENQKQGSDELNELSPKQNQEISKNGSSDSKDDKGDQWIPQIQPRKEEPDDKDSKQDNQTDSRGKAGTKEEEGKRW